MASPKDASSPYLVLARKYRPSSFSGLVGQDAMVQTLANAFKTGRVHHAFILTGVRGVGKTTTARILARAFNFADESGAHMTLDLDSEGTHCRAIIEGRHVDVVEMDAASNTSINDIREIIDSVKYGPVSAPYKVYIIDEVHMLSASAFNGLLKTLEEPPPYVKFIFATTEIRKVPVTILSRCQRFDLRRIVPEVMTGYLTELLEKEKISADSEALSMIVRAGEGSVRDCLSLLDQAISHGDGKVSGEMVKTMLGLSDRSRLIDLFDMLMRGDIAAALGLARALYDEGSDPASILADLAEVTHLVTRIKVVPAAADDAQLTPEERARAPEFAGKLGIRVLTRTWQILTKGLEEVARAADAIEALEMVLVRLVYAADLPTPDDLITKLNGETSPQASPSQTSGGQGGRVPVASGASAGRTRPVLAHETVQAIATAEPQTMPSDAPVAESVQPSSYAELVALAGTKRDLSVKHALEADLRPISFALGRLEVALTDRADPSIIATLSARLKAWTGRTWMVTVSSAASSEPTLREVRDAERADRFSAAEGDPMVQAVLETFPGARLVNVKVRDRGTNDADDDFDALEIGEEGDD